MIETRVTFQTSDELLQHLFSQAEKKSLCNIRDFAGKKVLVEGGGYEKIWLETQPMGGEMYAGHNMEVARNNQLLFMEYAREDGRMPGSIALIDGKVTPQFNKLQGFCFPAPALNLYYLLGKDQEYLNLLYQTLERFDAYLWKVRDSDKDGCLESWCKYDTGEDHALRYMDAPDAWEEEVPPQGCQAVPMASVDVMSYSYSARETLQKISLLVGREEWAKKWQEKAVMVRDKIESYLWSEERGACFDRDPLHRSMPTLTHHTLRAMYWNSLSYKNGRRFVREHLQNPEEFWTKMPLPSVAVNDPLFRNISTNNWSGQVEALTYQRAIRALENYDYQELIPVLGRKLFEAIGEKAVFTQQFDPFTAEPSVILLEGEQDGYGPAMLSVMEYTARMYGIHLEGEDIYWGCMGGTECTYTQQFSENEWKLENNGKKAIGYLNGKKVFTVETDQLLVTDRSGKIKRMKKIEEDRSGGNS